MDKREALQIAISAVQQAKGDDYLRAQHAFKNCTEAQMEEQYGLSGMTRRQVLLQYKVHDERMDAVITTLEDLALK